MHNNDPENPASLSSGRVTADAGLRVRQPVYIGNEIFRRPAFNGNHPLNIMRHATVFDLVRTLDWLPAGSFRESEPVAEEILFEFHDPAYVEALRDADRAGSVAPDIRQRHHIGTLANPLFPGLYQRARTAVGGSMLAAELACQDRVAFHPSGGTHHGRPDRASGFCYFNDPVFALLKLIELGKRRILYLDLDAHHGDGVENAFIDSALVTTVSIHEEKRWPYTGQTNAAAGKGAYNLPVPAEFNDSEFIYLLDHAVLPFASALRPDALVLCCGADCLAGDPLSKMRLTNATLWDGIERLVRLNVPTVILGGGGYNPWTVARYWGGLWGRLNQFDIPARLPEEAVRILSGLECELVDDDEVEPIWMNTLADPPNHGLVRESVKTVARTIISDGRINDVA